MAYWLLENQTTNGTSGYVKVYDKVAAGKNPILHFTGTFDGCSIAINYKPSEGAAGRPIISSGSAIAVTAAIQYEIEVRPREIEVVLSSAGGSTDITCEMS